ncbi:hypothetical protein BU26DRAFT_521354 [Trematosphaeria pertusa]|uniref:F-box domain-containing protein n=1 Tax=Trematosphaeria pertusa TaxID=390896 RepID=A0A6A6I6V0_9PLEO|nr:uncharacterized protein BU26DRAFT_521354 [Trematosphaeria pertusa]KAF2245798.1 hypothetical protein BU26DRAFT_521354 [Trematosphaeria pertusa]
MNSVNGDVLYYILFDVWTSHRPSLLNATLVCKRWHSIAQRILDGHLDQLIVSPVTEARNKLLFDRIESDAVFQKRIHTITVADVFSSGLVHIQAARFFPPHDLPRVKGPYGWLEPRSQSTWNQLEHLARVIERSSLRNLIWAAKPRMPMCIFDAVENCSTCRVQIQFRDDYADSRFGPVTFPSIETPGSLIALHGVASRLTRLGIVVPAFDMSSDTETTMLHTLGDLLSKSPLSALEIHAAGRLFANSVASPAFKTIRGFQWLPENVDCPLSLRKLRLTNFCLCDADEPTVMRFQHFVQCRDIEEAHFTCPAFLDLLSKRHTQLSALTLELDSRYESAYSSCSKPPLHSGIWDFLLSQNHLEVLSIINGTDVVQTSELALTETLFSHLGKSLEYLRIHEREMGLRWDRSTRIILSPSTIQVIGETCPRLRLLAIDAPWEDALLSNHLDCVRHHVAFIYHLQLSLEIEKCGQAPARVPVSVQRCVDMWHHLRDSPSQLHLRSLLVSIGAMHPLERCNQNRIDVMTRHQRRVLIRRVNEHESESGNRGDSLMATCLNVDEFEARLRYDGNATYGGLSKDHLDTRRKYWIEGSKTEPMSLQQPDFCNRPSR